MRGILTRIPPATRFGRLMVLCRAPSKRKAMWTCICNCGTVKDYCGAELTRKPPRNTRSCGCSTKQARIGGKWLPTHGKSCTPEFRSWAAMLTRCYNQNQQTYVEYGGRGITVCDEWRVSFEAFLRDMGPKPTPRHTIERNENDGSYCKDNCRWATYKEQANNRRPRRWGKRPKNGVEASSS